jgi:uncharacterized membrane protein YidH (DUF202 family)
MLLPELARRQAAEWEVQMPVTRKVWNSPKLAAILCLVAVIYAGLIATRFYAAYQYATHAVQTEARIIQETGSPQHSAQRPDVTQPTIITVRFRDQGGTGRTAFALVDAGFALQHRVGDVVTIHYDPADPRRIALQPYTIGLDGLLSGVLAFALLALSVLMYVQTRSQRPINPSAEVDQAFR